MSIALTKSEWNLLRVDMDQKAEMLTDEEIETIASKINDDLNVWIIKEEREKKILMKIIKKIDRLLYKNLPNEYYELIRFVDDGIDEDEAKKLKKRLANILNEHINIPWVPESIEQKLFEFVIGIIVNAMRKGFNLEKADAK